MAINYLIVQENLKEKGWTLKSTSYKNLSTPLEIVCPNGHELEMTYGQWRDKTICPFCIAGTSKVTKRGGLIPIKKFGRKRLLALDAATITTGYSIYDDDELVYYDHFTIPSSDSNITSRINKFKYWLIDLIKKVQPDKVGFEHIQLQTYGKFNQDNQVELYRKLANLQGVILDTLFEANIKYEMVYAVQWKSQCLIKKSQREEEKKQAQQKVFEWYNLSVTQDEADAICIGKYFILNMGETMI